MNKPIMDEEDAAAAEYSGQQLYRMLDDGEIMRDGDVYGDEGGQVSDFHIGKEWSYSEFSFHCLRPVSAATPESPWRDVDENTPRDETHIIGRGADGYSYSVYWSKLDRCWFIAGTCVRLEPVRWMPIPPDDESAEDKEWRAYCAWHKATDRLVNPDKDSWSWKAWKAAKGL